MYMYMYKVFIGCNTYLNFVTILVQQIAIHVIVT